MATYTRNAMAEIEREKDFTIEETLTFLSKREHFMSVSEGIKRELRRCKDCPEDERLLLSYFKDVLKKAGFTKDQRKNADKWLIDNVLPSPKYAVRLCFAFGLSGQAALDFLWKVCKVNGFNFRRAEDVVYCYCLERGIGYDDANTLIERYNAQTADQTYEVSDATKRTQTLRQVFGDLANLDENDFMQRLCSNKKNFIGYMRTANEEFLRIHKSLKEVIQADIDMFNNEVHSGRVHTDAYKHIGMEGCNGVPSVYPEIIYAFDKLAKAKSSSGNTFADIISNFPRSDYLNEMLSIESAATDKEHDKARKVFVLLFFANYVFDPPPSDYFGDFLIAINTELDRCGYAKLYPANPYDWLILNCVRSMEASDDLDGMEPIELFNDVLELLAEETDI